MKALCIALWSLGLCAHAENWPQWRGPRLDGTSAEKNIPIRWSATSNILWKTKLPGSGHASPIVYGDKVFTVSALRETQERVLFSLDRKTGKIAWQTKRPDRAAREEAFLEQPRFEHACLRWRADLRSVPRYAADVGGGV